MPEAGKQFEQMGLFPEGSTPKGGPAFQSPEDFRDDPTTVFHASYRALPKSGSIPSEFPGIHAGTYQAALERSTSHGVFDDSTTADHERADKGAYGTDAKIVMHALSTRGMPVPSGTDFGSVANPTSDAEANQAEYVHNQKTSRVYTNEAEDTGKLSVVFPKRPRLMLQGDWVKKQRAENRIAGRPTDQGVHPRTAAMYDAGTLDNYDQKTNGQIRNEVDPLRTDASQHDGGLFPFMKSTARTRVTDSTHPLYDPNHQIYGWKNRPVSREEMAGALHKIEGTSFDSQSEKYKDQGYPYHDRKAQSGYPASQRRDQMIEAHEVSGPVKNERYHNSLWGVGAQFHNHPGLGDIERTDPTGRADYNRRMDVDNAAEYDEAMAHFKKNAKPSADDIASFKAIHNEGHLGPRSETTGKRYDPSKPISEDNVMPAYAFSPEKKAANFAGMPNPKKAAPKKVAAKKSGNPDAQAQVYAASMRAESKPKPFGISYD